MYNKKGSGTVRRVRANAVASKGQQRHQACVSPACCVRRKQFFSSRGLTSCCRCRLFTPFRRVLPHLKELGWTKQQVLQQDSRILGSAIRHADIVICSVQIYQKHRSTTHFIIIDESHTGQLDLVDLNLLQNPQILAVLKPHIVTTPPQRRQTHRPLAGPQKKVHALIPLLWLWAFPLDCGSNLGYMRYTGFFQPQLAGWDRSKLWQRPVDVVLLTTNAAKGSPGHAHYQLAAYEVRKLKDRIPGLNVITQLADNYDEFLNRNLMDAKVSWICRHTFPGFCIWSAV